MSADEALRLKVAVERAGVEGLPDQERAVGGATAAAGTGAAIAAGGTAAPCA